MLLFLFSQINNNEGLITRNSHNYHLNFIIWKFNIVSLFILNYYYFTFITIFSFYRYKKYSFNSFLINIYLILYRWKNFQEYLRSLIFYLINERSEIFLFTQIVIILNQIL